MSEYFEIGKIVNTHGIKGAVKVMPITDEPKRFELLKKVTVKTRKETREYTISKIQYQKDVLIITFEEVKDMTTAEMLKTAIIYIPREEALPLEDDEYYISDIYGLKVITEEGQELGVVDDIIFTGANEVYKVKGEKELLIPAIKECIKEVNINEGFMKVELMKGLLDL
ncbi:ribosome maturation factor RimM [Vallitalea okinawensis]|uniref:ribosome maturation factor RimM n=1 Tax=Vallitalea okinawensis TaxID=2078660 RepID=UPI000CFD592C|nr:ribosome maturation factor RimM [Vallitalea okinawensis]